MVKEIVQKIRAAGGVLAPHQITESFADPLPEGDISVKILSVQDENTEHASKYSENFMVKCEYPSGFICEHQIPKIHGGDVLLTMLRNKLRGLHGVAHGLPATEGKHGLTAIAGDLIGELPPIAELSGKTIQFKKVG